MKNKFFKRNVVYTSLSSFLQRGWMGFLSVFFFTGILPAQDNNLAMVSTAERSDGKGYVLRFHLEQEVDSFKVFQPGTDLIQMTLYGENIDTTGIRHANSSPIYDEIGFYSLPFGVGVDIYVKEGEFFSADAYHDANSKDLLLGLTYAEKKDIKFLVEGIDPVIWSQFTVSEESMLVGGSSVDYQLPSDDTYEQIKNKMKLDVIVIDPGHGGHDPGSIGYKGTKEKDVVLDIAKKVGEYIKESEDMKDVKVVYTRTDDSFVDLEERGHIANKAEGDLFVSIHCNAFNNHHVKGSEVYFLGLHKSEDAFEVMKQENSVIRLEEGPNKTEELTEEDLLIYELANSGYIATSEKIAGMLEYQFDERAQRKSRGVKQAGFIVLYHASMPAILVESGFISNPSEQRYLTSDYGQNIIASAIFRAIRDYKVEYEKSQNFKTN